MMLAVFACLANDADDQQFKVGFSQPIMADDWRQTMYSEMQRQLIFHDNIELLFRNAEAQTSTQIAQILELVELGIDLLIVSPNEAAPLQPIIESVYDQGIPVVILDRRINSNKYTAYVGADNRLIGEEAGKYIARLLGGKGDVLEVYESLTITAFSDRHKGFRKVLEQYPMISTDSVRAMSWGADDYRTSISNNTYDVVFAATDVAARFAYDIAAEVGADMHTAFIGIDALPTPGGGLELVEKGVLTASILYPTGGDVAIEVAARILNGQPFEKENTLQTMVIDSTNVKIIQMQAQKLLDQQKDILNLAGKLDVIEGVFQTQRTLTYLFALTMLVSIIMTAFVLKALVEKRRTNQELQLKNEQVLAYSQQAEEATQARFRFFTNISHEFRTPLTLIKAPVDELLERKEVAPFRKDLSLIRKNTLRLLRLVDQVMDFRKIDNAKMKLQVSYQLVVPFLEDILDAFEKLANDNGVTVKLVADQEDLMLWFDQNMMDKVFFNLLSNAFKFTSRGGSVLVRVKSSSLEDEVVISVEDTGSGMAPEHVSHVFDRFYQGDANRSLGTGIGLSLSREIVELHQGKITVQSVLGRGTRFDIHLKKGDDHLADMERLAVGSAVVHREESLVYEQPDTDANDAQTQVHDRTILVVEDNDELRDFLVQKLASSYNMLEAARVRDGVRSAQEHVPDLIICDLMLQHELGYEIIQTLKEDLRTSHIPIIILSAKNTTTDKIKGLRLGADDYITKPFDFTLLKERIQTLLTNHQKLREHYVHELPVEASNPSKSGSRVDKKFVHEFTALVEQNISNPSFGVNELGQELGLSRVQLYRKVKALLGYSVNDYINSVKLKTARHLIAEGKLTFSEIAHRVGFSSSSYFSTAFKNQFGMTPSEYKAQIEK
ncbi:signal transduction histidine kinase [Marinoscillum furvescens DSM 4134]|uniref:histidine kinase n=2 Tax=Marinoscillum furvescens TaxID=1026 RepID=A0A3D9LJW5_MARFU|nr:signal transduction histidine kinase [Marinoscillum furvescens DSM 4134]